MVVKRDELDNGLTVITESMENVRSVALGIWIKSGSRAEPPELNGISHFIEHMLFKGSKKRSAEEIAKTIDRMGGQLDAFTSREYTGFYAKVLDEHLQEAFELIADIVLNPLFPEEEIERERNVIFEEINMVEDSPQELVHELFIERFWKGHPLGLPISGTKKTVGALGRRELLSYFRRCYSPQNIVVAAAGSLKHREVLGLARRYFGELEPRPNRKLGDNPPEVHPHIAKRNKEELEQVHICLGTVSPPLLSEHRFATHVLNNILGGGLSSRLFQNIREKRGLAYAIFSALNLYRDAGSLTVYAGTAGNRAEQVIELVLEELRKLRDGDISRDELERSKDNIKGAIVLSLESTSSRMSNLAQQEIYYQRYFGLNDIIRAVERVKMDDIKRVASEIFNSRYLSLTILGNLNGFNISRGDLNL